MTYLPTRHAAPPPAALAIWPCKPDGQARSAAPNLAASSLAARQPPLPARAKRVIFLCMSGGPAQLDTFDYKPQTGDEAAPRLGLRVQQHGQSGLWISELLPETARHADKLCVLNGMHADTGNHAQSFLQLHTGDRLRPRPSMGSWITYGLGTENQNLPGFISLNTVQAARSIPAPSCRRSTGHAHRREWRGHVEGDDQQHRRRSSAACRSSAGSSISSRR